MQIQDYIGLEIRFLFPFLQIRKKVLQAFPAMPLEMDKLRKPQCEEGGVDHLGGHRAVLPDHPIRLQVGSDFQRAEGDKIRAFNQEQVQLGCEIDEETVQDNQHTASGREDIEIFEI